MISVIIPCFNAGEFIKETLDSIVAQAGEIIEIIIVDDGSTDNTCSVIEAYRDDRIVYLYQRNKGVSLARNKGLEIAKGEFLIFFDADDKMSAGFLKDRKRVLEPDTSAGFSCGPVVSFPNQTETSYGVGTDVAKTLLTYDSRYSSCPSNYLIRKKVLDVYDIRFNENLSSTADRFFLIELAKHAEGILCKNAAPLYYRISLNSMSNQLTYRLVSDNEVFLSELKKHQLIPPILEQEFLYRIYFILGAGFIKTGNWLKGIKYLMTAALSHPKRFFIQVTQ